MKGKWGVDCIGYNHAQRKELIGLETIIVDIQWDGGTQ
jgi:hypothetical protein